MNKQRRLAAFVVVIAAALAGTSLPGERADAAAVTPLEPVYSDTVYGGATSVGNGSMRCPTAADGVNLRAGTSFAACADAQAGTVPAGTLTNNNDYSMRYQDADGDPATFNASSAVLTIPPGADIRYAMLEWGGHTGEFLRSTGTVSPIPSCNVVGQQYAAQFPTTMPAAPAAATPEAQHPGLQIGSGPRTTLTPDAVTRDSGAAWPLNSDRFYTGSADVTALLQDAGHAGDVTVTVSDIWAPQGVSCAAGWAITVVWAFDAPEPGVAEYASAISVFQGHVRQGAADAASIAQISGFEAASSTSRIGIVAYEGDRGSVGDRFSINGTDVLEPTGYGTTNDFFVSAAEGSSDPAWPVNFSTDVNVFSTGLVPAGSTEATLGFRTNGDGYWLQSLWMETPVASVSLTKTADITTGRPGDPVTWTITVTNPSPATLHDIVVTDPLEPVCDRAVPSAQVVATSFSYTCTGTLPDTTVVNTATVTATTDSGAPLTAQAQATVEVIHPALSLTKTADRALYRDGEPMTFELVVENTGDTDLTDVIVTDAQVAACSADLGTLHPGERRTTTCTVVAPLAGGVNTATATATDPLGNTVVADDAVDVPTAAPALDVRKSVSAEQVEAGGTATFTVEVTNTGDVRLDDVLVEDPAVPGCSAEVGSLAPGESHRTTCTWRATTPQTFTNVAHASGTAVRCALAAPAPCEQLGAPRLTAEDSADVRVVAAVDPADVLEDEGGAGDGADGPAARVLATTGVGVTAAVTAAALLVLAGAVLRSRRRT